MPQVDISGNIAAVYMEFLFYEVGQLDRGLPYSSHGPAGAWNEKLKIEPQVRMRLFFEDGGNGRFVPIKP